MAISVPQVFRPDHDGGHLLHVLRWPRPVPGTVRWVDDEAITELADLGLASKALADWVARERRFLDHEYWYGGGDYEPLKDQPALFKVFAELDGSESSFATFAETYGLLGLGVLTEAAKDQREAFGAWRLLWQDISDCSGLIDLAQSGPTTKLRERIAIGENHVDVSSPHSFKERLPSQIGSVAMKKYPLPNVGLEVEATWRAIHRAPSESSRLRMAARLWVQRKVNRWLSGRVFPEVLVSCKVTVDAEGRSWAMRFSPNSLAAAMWLQVARALEGDVVHRQCKSPKCRKWFVVSSNRSLGKRSDSQYCGDAKCRKEVFRAKRASGKGATK